MRRLSLLVVTVLLLGGCSSVGSTDETAGACGNKSVTLTLLRAENNAPDADVLADWKTQNPCIPISITQVPWGQLFDKTSVLASSANAPDIYGYDGPYTETYAANGMLLPLDKYISSEAKADILSATIEEHSYQGKLYSPGLEQSAMGLFFNKDMLDKLNIKPPRSVASAWTWTEALDAMKKCQQGTPGHVAVWGLAPSQFGNGTPGYVYQALNFLRSAGDPKADPQSSVYKTYWALSKDDKTANGWLNTPEALKAAQFYQDMFNKDGVTPKAGIPNAFSDGKACFDLQTSGLVANLKKANVKFQWGVTPLPYFKVPITQTGSGTLGVSAKTKHPDEAAKFVLFVTGAQEQLKHVKETGNLPALKSLFASLPEYDSYPLNIFKDELQQWGHPRPPSPYFLQYDKIVTDALRDIAYGANVKSSLDQAVAQLDSVLSQN